MRTWQHRAVQYSSQRNVVKGSDAFSREGWRLVSVVHTGVFGGYEAFYVKEVTEE